MSYYPSVKEGETKSIIFEIDADLTGSTLVKTLAYDEETSIDLVTHISNPERGEITHVLTGTLPSGLYAIEVWFTDAQGRLHKAPTNGSRNSYLQVNPDLDTD